MSLFGRKKKLSDDTSDEGIVGLFLTMVEAAEGEFTKFVNEHLQRIHEPGGYDREKKEADFMDLGMGRTYLDALDDIEFSVTESVAMPEVRGRSRGKGQVMTRWSVRGVHARPLVGIPPSGSPVAINGITVTTFRDYRIRNEFSYWELPELTRSVLER